MLSGTAIIGNYTLCIHVKRVINQGVVRCQARDGNVETELEQSVEWWDAKQE
jgi:hypothetical protein